MEKLCDITADEIYVKASVRYRVGNIIGLSVDQDPPKPAKTILGLMVNFLYGTPGFIARLLPLFSLNAEFLMEQLVLLIQIVHDAGGYAFLTMTDNLSVNAKMSRLFQQTYHPHTLASVTHPFANNFFKYLYQFYDPPHMLKNIRNNWTTEKTQTLEFRDPNSGEVVHAKLAHLKQIYNEEVNHPVKRTNLDYRSIYPNNFVIGAQCF